MSRAIEDPEYGLPHPVGTGVSYMRRVGPSLNSPAAVQTFSEIELEAELHLSRSDRRVTYRPKGIIADIGIRRPEYRVI